MTGNRGAPIAEGVWRELAGGIEGLGRGVAGADVGHGLAGLPGGRARGVTGDLDEFSIGVADVDAGDRAAGAGAGYRSVLSGHVLGIEMGGVVRAGSW